MDFTFTDDELAFRAAVSRLLMAEVVPESLHDISRNGSDNMDQLRQKIVEQGVLAMSVPEEAGGLGQDDITWSLIHQELGYHAIPDSLVDTAYLAVGLICGLGATCKQRASWLERIADGSLRVAVGHPLNQLVPGAERADLFLLKHNDDVHAVPRGQVSIAVSTGLDPSRRLARVDWQPSASTRVACDEAGRRLWARTLEQGALATAGLSVGLAQRMLDLAVDYAAQRKQFGRPVGSFQSVKHQLADVATAIEFAKPVLYRAAHAVARDESDVSVWVSQAKLACSQAAWVAARHGIQVHGAMGYTWEVDLQIFMKRAWALDAWWGDRGFHKSRVAAFVLNDPAALIPGRTFKE